MRCITLSQFAGRLVALFAACLLVAVQVDAAQAVSFYSTEVINTTSPVLYWDLDEASGPTAADLSPINGSNTGTYSGSTFGSAGPRPSDGFLGMNSSNNGSSGGLADEVVISNLQSGAGVGTAAYSAQIWFNSSAAFNSQTLSYIFGRGDSTSGSDRRDAIFVGGSFGSTTPGVLYAFNGDGNSSLPGTSVLLSDTWYHLVMVRDDSLATEQLKFYLNGNTIPELTINGDWAGVAGNVFSAGNRTDTNNNLGLTGTFDEVAIWDYALTPTQVQSLYNTAVIGFTVPEPSSLTLLGFGLFGLLRYARRKQIRATQA